jgi:hypothetical protein
VSGAARPFLGAVHTQCATAELVAVELLDSVVRLIVRLELDERESAGTTGLAVIRHEDITGLADLREERLQLLTTCIEIEISYEDFGSH